MLRKICTLMMSLLTVSLFAEKIYLVDGTIVTGDIITQEENYIVVDSTIGRLEIEKKRIEKIEYDSKEKVEKPKNELVNNGCFYYRPLATIAASLLGAVDFMFEGQTAISEKITITSIGEVGSIAGIYVTGLNIGIQANITGEYLDGLYMGCYPGIIYAIDAYNSAIGYSVMIDLGYQSVLDSGFTWGAFAGYYLASVPGFKFGVKIGWAFPDPLVNIYK